MSKKTKRSKGSRGLLVRLIGTSRLLVVGFVLLFLPTVASADARSISSQVEQITLDVASNKGKKFNMVVNSVLTTDELKDALHYGEYKYQRRHAAQLLGEREEEAGHILPHLLVALRDSEDVVQSAAAESLGKLGDDTVVDELIANMADSNCSVKKYSAYVLGRIGKKLKTADGDAIEALETLALDENRNVRAEAIYALYETGSTASTHTFIQGLSDEYERVRGYSATALGEIGGPEAGRALARALDAETDDNLRREIAAALGRLGSDYAVDFLVERLPFESESVRLGIVEKLGESKSARSLEVLSDLLLEDPSPNVRSMAAMSLRDARAKSATKALAAALSDRVPIVRRPASEALIDLVDVSVMDELVGALGDTDDQVGDNAAQALMKLGNLDVVDKIIALVNSPRTDEARRACAVLEAVTYRPYGFNPELWTQWYEESFKTESE